jgi:hypothetical protein
MKCRLFGFLVLVFACCYVQAQSNDTNNVNHIQKSSADDIVYMKAEIMPTFKTGLINLEDTLTKGLVKLVQISKKTYSLIYSVQIQKDGTVLLVQKFDGQDRIPFEKELEAVLLSTSGLWEPAMQNNKAVNARKVIRLTISNRRVNVEY